MKKEIESMNKIMDLSNIIKKKKNFNFQTINRLYENKEKQLLIILLIDYIMSPLMPIKNLKKKKK